MDFNKFWTLFQPDKEYESRMSAAQREWDKCSANKQQAIIDWLETHGRYKGRNPFFFIQDFKVKQPKAQPTNYRGKTIPGGMRVYSAKWNGAWGMYTEADIKAYQMERYVDVVSHTTTMDERSGDKNIAEVQNI